MKQLHRRAAQATVRFLKNQLFPSKPESNWMQRYSLFARKPVVA